MLDDSERDEIIALVADQSGEMADIIEDLLVAARAEAGVLTVLAEEAILDAEVRGVPKPLELELECDPSARPAAVAATHCAFARSFAIF